MAFFYPHRFREVRSVLENVNLGEFILIRLQTPRERKNRIHLDEYYFFNAAIPPKEEFGTNRRHALGRQLLEILLPGSGRIMGPFSFPDSRDLLQVLVGLPSSKS